jgi:hypothetical protein
MKPSVDSGGGVEGVQSECDLLWPDASTVDQMRPTVAIELGIVIRRHTYVML